MICGVPLSNDFMSCGLRAPVSERSDGLPRRLASCGLPGFTPGARPTVELSDGCVVDRPGTGPPELFGPLTVLPGALDEAAPLCGCELLVPLVPEDEDPAPLCDAAFVPVVPEEALPPLLPPPPLWARASPPESARIATVVQRRFMGQLRYLDER
jgi:hypothetical protein